MKSMKETKDKAFQQFEGMLSRGSLDGLIIYDLMQSYTFNLESEPGLEGHELRDALRKVLAYYMTEDDYNKFMGEVHES